jgi:p-aminobenzoyl-glutamate transporter AbgT
MESEALMSEMIARLLMVLTGFVLAMLGVIVFVHSGEHQMLGILISFAGVVSMFGGLPDNA